MLYSQKKVLIITLRSFMKVQIIFFLVSESKQGTRKKYEALNSFSGCKEGLEKTIEFMYGLSDEDESYRGLKRIK